MESPVLIIVFDTTAAEWTLQVRHAVQYHSDFNSSSLA